MKGTPLFMAPEMLLKRKCGRRVDVWSLGCAVLEMVTTRPPWADAFKHPVEIIEHFTENPGPPPLPPNLAPSLQQFLLSCFTWDAELRPSAQELCGHQYLQARALPPAADGAPGDDVPLEEMDRVSAVTRMRRCSSATLDLLAVQARQAALGVSIGGALAAFGTAPSGTFRPPSPRYGPGSLAGHSKRTPSRRRMYTETGMPPPESPAASGIANTKAVTVGANNQGVAAGYGSHGAELTRRFSMPAVRTPPLSPDKPRRPGRGSSGGSTDEEGRVSGPILASRLRSMGHGVDHSSSCSSRSVSSGDSGGSTGSGGSNGHGDSSSLSNNFSGTGGPAARSSSAPHNASGTGGGAAAVGPSTGGSTRMAPTPRMPPLVHELLGVTMEGGKAGGGGADDTPPPTVLPLELRRPASSSAGEPSWPSIAHDATANGLLQQRRREGATGLWATAGMMSDTRGGVAFRH